MEISRLPNEILMSFSGSSVHISLESKDSFKRDAPAAGH